MTAPLPPDERERLQALWRQAILDTPPEAAFDRITKLAARLLKVSIAQVTLVDEHRQWIKSSCGLKAQEAPREWSFCAHAILTDQLTIVPDATRALAVKTAVLERSNADLAQFGSVASHDLQEPLRAVAGCVQMLERTYRGKLDSKADELIRMIVGGSARMKDLIDGLLAYASSGGTGTLEVIDAGAALQTALAGLSAAIRDSKAEVTHGNLPCLRFHPTQFEQILQNLIGNAVKYRDDRVPKIQVSAQRQEDRWLGKGGMGHVLNFKFLRRSRQGGRPPVPQRTGVHQGSTTAQPPRRTFAQLGSREFATGERARWTATRRACSPAASTRQTPPVEASGIVCRKIRKKEGPW